MKHFKALPLMRFAALIPHAADIDDAADVESDLAFTLLSL